MNNNDENYYGDTGDSIEDAAKETGNLPIEQAAKNLYNSTKNNGTHEGNSSSGSTKQKAADNSSATTTPDKVASTADATSSFKGNSSPTSNGGPAGSIPSSAGGVSGSTSSATAGAAGGGTAAGAAGGAAGGTAGGAAGAAAGGSAGATAGAAAGSIVPIAGTAIGAAAGGAAGTAAGGAAAGGTAGATAGGTAGAVAGKGAINTAREVTTSGVDSSDSTTSNSFTKTLKGVGITILAIFLFIMALSSAIEELLPNVITKPVATAVATTKGIYETVKGWFSNFIDFFTGGGTKDEETQIAVADLNDATRLCIEIIKRHMDKGYESLEDEIEQLCLEKGWDVETTMTYMQQNGASIPNTDYAFIMAVYSISTDFDMSNIDEFKKKLDDSIKITYTFTAEEKATNVLTPYDFHQFNPEWSTLCYNEYDEYDEDGNYEDTVHEGVDYQIFYDSGETAKRDNGTDWLITDPNGETIPNYVRYVDKYGEKFKKWDSSSSCHRLNSDVYIIDPDQPEILVKPSEDKEVKYGEITYQAYDSEDVYGWFGVDPDAIWKKVPNDPTYKASDEFSDDEFLSRFKVTNRQMVKMRIDTMQGQIQQALSAGSIRYDAYGLSEQEINSYLDILPSGTTGNQKQVVKTSLSLVGMVPYYFGGKASKAGWDEKWWSTISPDSKGRDKKGLDCSGYVAWVFATAGFNNGMIDNSINSTYQIRSGLGALKSQIKYKSDLQPGDIGVGQTGANSWHTGIYLGNNAWVHCSSSGGRNGGGTVKISENYNAFNLFYRYHPEEMAGDNYYDDKVTLYGAAGASFGCTASETDILLACVIQENDTEEGMMGVAEVMRNRSTSSGACLWSILVAPGQYGSYLHGDYKRIGSYTTKSGRKGNRLDELAEHPEKRELITQVFSGAKSLFNNPQVYYQVTHGVRKPDKNATFYVTIGEDYYTLPGKWSAKEVHPGGH